MAQRAVHVAIRGRVQGVGYRAWCAERASDLGLSGWVRNRSNGDVEAVFAGPANAVDTMLAACAMGPISARVTEIRSEPENSPIADGFHIRR